MLNEIKSEHFINAGDVLNHREPALDMVTFCILITKSGFTFTGESICISSGYNINLARKHAKEMALNKLHSHMEYFQRKAKSRIKDTLMDMTILDYKDIFGDSGNEILKLVLTSESKESDLRG